MRAVVLDLTTEINVLLIANQAQTKPTLSLIHPLIILQVRSPQISQSSYHRSTEIRCGPG